MNGGAIRIDGQDVAHATQASLRAQIAIVQQEPILFHRSLAENIAYGRPGARHGGDRARGGARQRARLHRRLPNGYQTLVGERGVKLSGGERQRVALARAFLADAPILILDEATSSLDSESELLIQEAMARLMRGRTAIVIAHRLSTVRAMDRILVFDRGPIAEEGSHAELVRRDAASTARSSRSRRASSRAGCRWPERGVALERRSAAMLRLGRDRFHEWPHASAGQSKWPTEGESRATLPAAASADAAACDRSPV